MEVHLLLVHGGVVRIRSCFDSMMRCAGVQGLPGILVALLGPVYKRRENLYSE